MVIRKIKYFKPVIVIGDYAKTSRQKGIFPFLSSFKFFYLF